MPGAGAWRVAQPLADEVRLCVPAGADGDTSSVTALESLQAQILQKDYWRTNLRGEHLDGANRASTWWTGKTPEQTPGFDAGKLTSLSMPNLSTCTRQDIMDYFDNTWTLTEVLLSSLHGEEAFYRPPYHNLRHPMIFYYAHPAVLYINKLRVAGILSQGMDAEFEALFETGVDEMTWDDMSKNEMVWPAVSAVTEYRRQVYCVVRNVIAHHDSFCNLPISQDSPAWAVFMGFEHERIHLETSSVLMRELPIWLIKRPNEWPAYQASAADDTPIKPLISVEAGDALLGKPSTFPSYGWDNEYGSRTIHVPAFEASRCLVTNGQYLEFVKSSGYSNPSYWTPTGWKWRAFRNTTCPCFWVPKGAAGTHQYALRLIFEIVPFQRGLPAIVNYHEAKAYWDGLDTNAEYYRLATEPEHHRMRSADPRAGLQDPVMFCSGTQLQGKININLAYGAESRVDGLPPNELGFHDITGNAWQWCEDHFAPLPGFRVHRFYEDFSLPCFDGEHNIIMGGSFISTGDEASLFSRFHFRPHFFQHAGIRMVKAKHAAEAGALPTSCLDAPGPRVGNPCCTTSSAGAADGRHNLATELSAHFPAAVPYLRVPTEWQQYPQTLVKLLFSVADQLQVRCESALDVGSSVGGVTFALAARCTTVAGIDANPDFIEAAQMLQQDGELEYTLAAPGESAAPCKAVVALPPASRRDRASFRRMDPCSMAPDMGSFDVVTIVNTLSRLPNPAGCLARMGGPRGLVRVGGLLLVADTFLWDEAVTPKELWLTAPSVSGGNGASKLQDVLGVGFELVRELADVPFAAHIARRQLAVLISNVSIWRRLA